MKSLLLAVSTCYLVTLPTVSSRAAVQGTNGSAHLANPTSVACPLTAASSFGLSASPPAQNESLAKRMNVGIPVEVIPLVSTIWLGQTGHINFLFSQHGYWVSPHYLYTIFLLIENRILTAPAYKTSWVKGEFGAWLNEHGGNVQLTRRETRQAGDIHYDLVVDKNPGPKVVIALKTFGTYRRLSNYCGDMNNLLERASDEIRTRDPQRFQGFSAYVIGIAAGRDLARTMSPHDAQTTQNILNHMIETCSDFQHKWVQKPNSPENLDYFISWKRVDPSPPQSASCIFIAPF